jgi:hypothetical protein
LDEPDDDPGPLPLNCPHCWQPLHPLVSGTRFVYLCMRHGRFFVVTNDGELRDVPCAIH